MFLAVALSPSAVLPPLKHKTGTYRALNLPVEGVFSRLPQAIAAHVHQKSR